MIKSTLQLDDIGVVPGLSPGTSKVMYVVKKRSGRQPGNEANTCVEPGVTNHWTTNHWTGLDWTGLEILKFVSKHCGMQFPLSDYLDFLELPCSGRDAFQL